ncbi:hypothetical protein XI05_11875 [Bradyrhizobium sp. CCBAU 11357]|nr:hypothetical protein [Bradyrhizobium sp. CCBAU 11357]
MSEPAPMSSSEIRRIDASDWDDEMLRIVPVGQQENCRCSIQLVLAGGVADVMPGCRGTSATPAP